MPRRTTTRTTNTTAATATMSTRTGPSLTATTMSGPGAAPPTAAAAATTATMRRTTTLAPNPLAAASWACRHRTLLRPRPPRPPRRATAPHRTRARQGKTRAEAAAVVTAIAPCPKGQYGPRPPSAVTRVPRGAPLAARATTLPPPPPPPLLPRRATTSLPAVAGPLPRRQNIITSCPPTIWKSRALTARRRPPPQAH